MLEMPLNMQGSEAPPDNVVHVAVGTCAVCFFLVRRGGYTFTSLCPSMGSALRLGSLGRLASTTCEAMYSHL